MNKVTISILSVLCCFASINTFGQPKVISIDDFSKISTYLAIKTNSTINIDTASQLILDIKKIPLKDTSNFLKYSGVFAGKVFTSFRETTTKIANAADKTKWLSDIKLGNYYFDILNFFSDDNSAIVYLATSKEDTSKQKIFISKIKANDTGKNKPGDPNIGSSPAEPFITQSMIDSVGKTDYCSLCSQIAAISSRKERKFSTDYFILFDASRRQDDYTICKHIFKKDTTWNGKKGFTERYRKVASAWFAPSVGSQLKFEVVNMPLNDHSKIVVNDSDLFLNNSSFQSVINNQLASTIFKVSTLTPDTSKKSNNGSIQAGLAPNSNENKIESDSAKIYRLFNELSNYVRAFNISPCTIAANRTNTIVIRSRIATQFKLGGDILNELVKHFDTSRQKDIAVSIKSIISSLDSLQPLVYSTARLVNRDYLNIKLITGNNETIVNENIRTSFGLKIDYSTGVFLTGLRDDSYIFKDTTINYTPSPTGSTPRDTSGNFLRKQIPSSYNVGFGVLAHVYPRLSSNYNIGLTAGFMSTTNLDLNILLGGSLMLQSLFGSNNRLVLNAGVAWGKVKRLSSAYQADFMRSSNSTTGAPIYYATTGDPTVQVWSHSWFFGLSFNFK